MIKFYCFEKEYSITESAVYINGDLFEEGKVRIQTLLLGEPAILYIRSHDPKVSEKRMVTDVVTAVLPECEYYRGTTRFERYLFKISYRQGDECGAFHVAAVNDAHAKKLCSMAFRHSWTLENIERREMK